MKRSQHFIASFFICILIQMNLLASNKSVSEKKGETEYSELGEIIDLLGSKNKSEQAKGENLWARLVGTDVFTTYAAVDDSFHAIVQGLRAAKNEALSMNRSFYRDSLGFSNLTADDRRNARFINAIRNLPEYGGPQLAQREEALRDGRNRDYLTEVDIITGKLRLSDMQLSVHDVIESDFASNKINLLDKTVLVVGNIIRGALPAQVQAAQATSSISEKTVKFPSKKVLLHCFSKKNLDHFIEKTKIVETLLSGEKYALGVANAVELALYDYEEDIKKTMSAGQANIILANMHQLKPMIYEILLQDDSTALTLLQNKGIYKPVEQSASTKKGGQISLPLGGLLFGNAQAQATSSISEKTVKFPSKEVLKEALLKKEIDYIFNETFLDDLLSCPKRSLGVAMAVENALCHHEDTQPKEKNAISSTATDLKRSKILETLLQDDPEALFELKEQKIYVPSRVIAEKFRMITEKLQSSHPLYTDNDINRVCRRSFEPESAPTKKENTSSFQVGPIMNKILFGSIFGSQAQAASCPPAVSSSTQHLTTTPMTSSSLDDKVLKDDAVAQAMLKVQQRLTQLKSDSFKEEAENAAAIRALQTQAQANHEAKVLEVLNTAISSSHNSSSHSNNRSNNDNSGDRDSSDRGSFSDREFNRSSGGNRSSGNTAGSLSVCGRGRESLGLSYDSRSNCYNDRGSRDSHDGVMGQ